MIAAVHAAVVFAAEVHSDSKGITTPHKWWPEPYEIIWGGLASLVIFGGLYKFAVPALKKSMAARSVRLGNELSSAAAAKADATTSAATIRANKGDLAATTAARVLDEGRARIAAEIADLEAKATADIAAAQVRAQGEVQTDVATIASHALEQVVTGSIDAATHNALIEDVIAKIGAAS
jgi:F-type H+-transporting ATPase subunit b